MGIAFWGIGGMAVLMVMFSLLALRAGRAVAVERDVPPPSPTGEDQGTIAIQVVST